MKTGIKNILFLLSLFSGSIAVAGGVYQQPIAFISQVFNNQPPKPQVLWPDTELKKQMTNILNHKYRSLRIRYWKQGQKTAWILKEIGKEKLITVGIVIRRNHLERIKILAFHESRGWEVRHAFFTRQFNHAKLKQNNQLDNTIDNISGATLSVRAVTKLTRIALLLNQHINKTKASQINTDQL